jgi:DNA-directed RNA polymerase alpha subunit
MRLKDKISSVESELKPLLTVRCFNILAGVGITTLEQLANADDIELLRIPTFGKRQLAECLDCLKQHYKNETKQERQQGQNPQQPLLSS